MPRTATCVSGSPLSCWVARRCRVSWPSRSNAAGASSSSISASATTFRPTTKQQQKKLREQQRETRREYIDRESHYVWGRRYLLSIDEVNDKPAVKLGHRRLSLKVRPGSSPAKRAEVMHEWHKALLHAIVPGLISRWEGKLGVRVSGYFLQRMKTKWGSCNTHKHNVRLNTELVKKPKDLLEYVVVHEMVHLLEPSHNERFLAILDHHWPQWRESRGELNALPLGSETWSE